MVNINERIKEYGYINFKCLVEDWSEYLLDDKTIIRTRVVPMAFKKKTDKIYKIKSVLELVSFCPLELIGPPSEIPIPVEDTEVIKTLDKIDMKFETLKEPWNEYELEDDTRVFLKTVATSISRSKLYDREGETVYRVERQVLTKRYPP